MTSITFVVSAMTTAVGGIFAAHNIAAVYNKAFSVYKGIGYFFRAVSYIAVTVALETFICNAHCS